MVSFTVHCLLDDQQGDLQDAAVIKFVAQLLEAPDSTSVLKLLWASLEQAESQFTNKTCDIIRNGHVLINCESDGELSISDISDTSKWFRSPDCPLHAACTKAAIYTI